MEIQNWITPLWKMKISEQQYADLKKELKEVITSINKFEINKLTKKAALYYAEWWRREYNGGTPSKRDLVNSLGLSDDYRNELFELAKEGGRQLDINIIRKSNTQWFRSLLIQGGLPINHIKSSSENLSAYKNFLKGLIRYAKTVSVDWTDTEFINSLSCSNYLPESFKNEDIFELSLQIVKAIVESNDVLFPYDIDEQGLEEFTAELKQSSKSFSFKIPFVIQWKGLKEDQNIELFYSVDCAQRISNAFIQENNLGDFYSLSLYVNHYFIASYFRTTNNDFVLREKTSANFKWNKNPILEVYLKADNNDIIELTIPNVSAPEFDNPVIFSKSQDSGNFWQIRNASLKNNLNAIVFAEDWKIIDAEDNTNESVFLNNNQFNWHFFSNTITLKNSTTEEILQFDENSTSYSHEFLNWSVDWIQRASQKVLIGAPQIRVYDEKQEKIASNRYKVQYRKFQNNQWFDYIGNDLPNGLLEFKIIFPDGKHDKEKFFVADNLSFQASEMTQNHGSIEWNFNEGRIAPLKNQSGIEIENIEKNKWLIKRLPAIQNTYPDVVGFRFIPENNNSYLDIYVATPFKGIALLDEHGQEITNRSLLSSTSLYKYRLIVMGFNKIPVRIFQSKNKRVAIKEELKPGIHSFSRFEDSINKIFHLYGKDPFDIYSKVQLEIGSNNYLKQLNFKDYNVSSKSQDGKPPIEIVNTREEMNPIDFKGKLQAVSVACSSDEINVVELQKKEDGFYFAPGEEMDKFILFTDRMDNQASAHMVVPRFFDFSGNPDFLSIKNDEGSLSPQEKNILDIKQSLTSCPPNGEEWKKVIHYFIIAIQKNLPFKTFNQFRAIAEDPVLLAKMHIQLKLSSELSKTISAEKYLAAMANFEENLAIAFHWLSIKKHWMDAIEWFINSIPDIIHITVLTKIHECIKEILDYTLLNQDNELINSLLNDEQKTNTTSPSNAELNDIRSKFGFEENLPETKIIIPKKWLILFNNAANSNLPRVVRSFLFSPVKAALAFSGIDDSIWNQENQEVRRTINFYRNHRPIIYLELFSNMVKQIKSIQKHSN